jgi:hypothetical protein
MCASFLETKELKMDRKRELQAADDPRLAEGAGTIDNGIDQVTANLIARVNAVAVTPEELCDAAAEIQKTITLEDCDREARTRCLASMFEGQGYKAFAVNYRLEAMARVIGSGKLPNCWVLPDMVKETVFLAASKEPILFTKKVPFFEAESFIAFLLENAGVDGHA